MSRDENKQLAENKLILLYAIGALNIPVSNLQITKIILENRFMNYFSLQQHLDELCESNYLLCEKKESKLLYSLTESGKESLKHLSNLIPQGIRKNIDSNIKTEKRKIMNQTMITADYTPESENEFVVVCKINEGTFNLLELRMTVGSRNDAQSICDNWKNHSQSIFPELIDILTKNRE